MIQFTRDQGAIAGRLPRAETPAVARPRSFPEVDEPNRGWRRRAACRDSEDLELWFPIGNTGPALKQIEDAKAVCHRCPVVNDCLGWALATGQDFGVWGGLSEDERRNLKRRAARARSATNAQGRP